MLNSRYLEYCTSRELLEGLRGDKVNLGISDKQIAQAFILRASDFCNESTKCGLVVTSKVLYNSNALQWRQYFLSNFFLEQVFELSAVNSKIFNGASWPAVILFYSFDKGSRKNTSANIVHHISLKPNRFLNTLKQL